MELLLEPTPAFQERLDAAPPGALVRLLPGEYPGPVVVRRPLTIDGQGATVWALAGPALAIDADRVRVRHLGVEATGGEAPGSPAGCALLVCAGRQANLENVVVRGLIGEDGCWRLPDALHLGRLGPGEEHAWTVRLYAPVPCGLAPAVAGLEVVPAELAAGANEVRLTLEALPPDTLLHGELNVISPHLTRRIAVVAHVLSGEATEQPALLWGPADWDELVARGAPTPPRELVLPALPAPQALRPLPAVGATARSLPPPPAPVVPGAVPPVASPAMPAAAPSSLIPPLPSALVATPSAPSSAPAAARRKVSGPLVSDLFDPAPAASAAAGEPAPAAPSSATPPAPATPGPTAPPGRPVMKLRPVSRLFNQSATPPAEAAPPAPPAAPEGEEPKREG
jgi:hypothetical protein